MNKTLIIIITLMILLVGGITATIFSQNKKIDNTNVTYTDFNITFPSPTGNVVITNNFLQDPSVVEDTQNPGLYNLGSTIAIQPETGELPPYVVSYDKESGSFSVVLLQKPFDTSRKESEEYLKNLLKIDTSKICTLSYMVTVPGYVDQSASGVDYRFSFCSDAIPL